MCVCVCVCIYIYLEFSDSQFLLFKCPSLLVYKVYQVAKQISVKGSVTVCYINEACSLAYLQQNIKFGYINLYIDPFELITKIL